MKLKTWTSLESNILTTHLWFSKIYQGSWVEAQIYVRACNCKIVSESLKIALKLKKQTDSVQMKVNRIYMLEISLFHSSKFTRQIRLVKQSWIRIIMLNTVKETVTLLSLSSLLSSNIHKSLKKERKIRYTANWKNNKIQWSWKIDVLISMISNLDLPLAKRKKIRF